MKRIINFFARLVRVKKNYIVFFASHKVDGNPKSIYLYIKKHYSHLYRCIYLVDKNMDYEALDKRDVCFYRTLKGYYYQARAKYWILSDSTKTLINKKKNQIYIQTFHGHGPVKRGGLEIEKIRLENNASKLSHIKDWDYYISMCEEDEKHIINSTGYDKKVYRLGISSTDEIVNALGYSKSRVDKLKKKYGIPLNKKVILYAPTYREYLLGQANISLKIEKLKELTNYVVLVRLHPLLNSRIDKSIFDEGNFINVCDVGDIVDLYPVADILISDYSACIYEFALTKRKIILYPYDYKEYEKYPGYVIDYKKVMPGPICYDESKLYDIINNESDYFKDYSKRIGEFNKHYNYLNDGGATKRFVEYLNDEKFL